MYRIAKSDETSKRDKKEKSNTCFYKSVSICCYKRNNRVAICLEFFEWTRMSQHSFLYLLEHSILGTSLVCHS